MSAPIIVIDLIGGNCPVQAEGTINGAPFYFRARGARWRVEVGEPHFWSMEQPFGEWPDAGWMSEDDARGFIEIAAGLFAKNMLAHPV